MAHGTNIFLKESRCVSIENWAFIKNIDVFNEKQFLILSDPTWLVSNTNIHFKQDYKCD